MRKPEKERSEGYGGVLILYKKSDFKPDITCLGIPGH
jgi:hypothetical protein